MIYEFDPFVPKSPRTDLELAIQGWVRRSADRLQLGISDAECLEIGLRCLEMMQFPMALELLAVANGAADEQALAEWVSCRGEMPPVANRRAGHT